MPIIFQSKGWRFQPVSASDVADVLVGIVQDGLPERVPDVVGPQVLRLNEMLRTWLDAKREFELVKPPTLW